jgi:hypothetical protein
MPRAIFSRSEAQSKLDQRVLCVEDHDVYHAADSSGVVFCGMSGSVVRTGQDEEGRPYLEISWSHDVWPDHITGVDQLRRYDKKDYKSFLRELPPDAASS